MNDLGIGAPDVALLAKLSLRLLIACGLGAAIGLEREARGRAAGLRTHMLVALGAALFTVIPLEAEGTGRLAEIVKGITAGVGFLGAGAILKRQDAHRISGITTAASIWSTAAVGFSVGAGWIGIALIATGLTWLILRLLGGMEEPLHGGYDKESPSDELEA